MQKSKYTVYNKICTAPITLSNQMLTPDYDSTYLGFNKAARDINAHLKIRLKKAKSSSFATMALLRRLPELRPKIQVQIIKCTVAATMTYGIEACNLAQIKAL